MKKNKAILAVAFALVCGAHAALIGEWSFDGQNMYNAAETPATTHRGIYRYHNGTAMVNSETGVFSTDTRLGEGYSLDLSAAKAHMYIHDSTTYLPTTTFTYSVFVKVDGWQDGTWDTILSKQSGGSAGFALRHTSNLDYTGVDLIGETTNIRDVTDQVNVADNGWHHLAFTYDGTTAKYYIDGVLRRSLASDFTPDTGSFLVLGAQDTAGNEQFGGLVDDLSVYDTALTAEEIAAIAIPEPATLGMVLSFSVAIVAIRRRLIM
ncbi:hypothetical protein PDESU_00019 [Pontiella desulfatans]|uniref:LamG-like jellyroll fold domain-containing protein n=1 Tax=Pontiella desulfatans TaxID=2750659 RepID=A0A6C2TV55_PONDE|nr:LamG domain-containing protein [Pontiella desulfatans]VGO11475.1 hypothetical protein PDESU_00019 [Pontiella desulfatans]